MMKFKNIVFTTFLLSLPLILSEGVLHSRELVITHFTATLGAAEIAAYSIGYTLYNLMVSFNNGFTMGLGVVATRKLGQKDYAGTAETMINGYFIGIILALILTLIIFNTDLILKLLHEPPQLLTLASQFTSTLAFAVVPAVIAVTSQQLALLIDRPKYIFIFMFFAVLLIILFTYIFGMGHFGSPRMGLRGFGLAMSLAALFECSCWLVLISVHPVFKEFPFRKYLFSIKLSIVTDILRTGLPLGTKQIVATNGILWVFTLLLGKIGTVDLAVFQILLTIITILTAIPNGVSRVIAIKIGKQLGALQIDTARQFKNAGFLIVTVITIIAGIWMLLAPTQIVSLLLTPHGQEEILIFQTTAQLLRFSGFVALSGAFMIIGFAALAGFKDTLFTLITEICCCWGVALPISYFLNNIFHGGVRDYWLGLFIGITLAFSIYLIRIRYQFKKFSVLNPH